jgi:hypothetical protein
MTVMLYMYCHNVFFYNTQTMMSEKVAVVQKMSVYSSENCIMKNSMKNVPRCTETHQ